MTTTNTMTVTLPTTITVAMLVRESTSETLRQASRFEIDDAARNPVSGGAYGLTTILTWSGEEIPCRIEYITRPMTDAEYNAMLDEVS